MSDDRIVISSGSAISPETIANRTFAASFRGFDQAEVRVFLKRVADEVAAATEREEQLRQSLQDAMARAAHPELDEAVLTNALGEHTARLLTNARESAAAMVSDAEARAARILQEGEGRIARMRAEAETLLARRAEEAERLAGGLRQAADSDARTLRERARADAQAEIEAARSQGREMVAEAKELRERMLSDLLRRRRMAEGQIEQLRLAHQRLLQAQGVVRRTLDEATGELAAAEADTRPVLEAMISRTEAQQGYPRVEAEGRSGPAEREYQGPSGPAEREYPGPSGPAEREYQGPSGPRRLGAPEFRPAPLPDLHPQEHPEAPPAPPEPAVAAGPAPDEAPAAAPGQESQGPESPAPHASPAPVVREPAAADAGGLAGLGGGTIPAAPGTREASGGRRSSTPLSPVDIAAPGEEVRVVRETDEPEPAPAAADQEVPADDAGAANGAPVPSGAGPSRPSRRQRRGREGDQPASGHVEELFARLRAAQQRRDAADAGATAEDEAPPADEPAAAEAAPPEATDAPPAATSGTAGADAGGRHLSDEKALYRRDELLDPIDTDLSRRLKRVLQDEQNQVLDRLRRQSRPTAEATLPDLVEQTEQYRSAAAPLLRQAAESGASFATETAGGRAQNKVDESIDSWAADLAIELVTPLRERLERALQDASADEDADATVGERLSASYRQWKLQHIEQVTRHYSSAAFTRGAFAAMVEGTNLRWIVDDDGPCPDCEDNALAGPTPKGQSFPTGQVHPPAHPGCRCLLVPDGV